MSKQPVYYSAEIADTICARIANGESLNAICKSDGMPSRTVVYEWIDANRDGLADKYARARRLRAAHYGDEIVEIADSVCGRRATNEEIQAARLAIDARKWVAARMDPPAWGDRTMTTIAGADGGPVSVRHDVTITAAEAYRRLKDGGQ
jgi:hypothetical protein